MLRATVSNLFGRGSSVLVTFLLTPFILGQLGPSWYGLLVLAGSLAGYGALLDLGIGGAVIRFVAHHSARDETDRVNAVIATASWLYLALGAVALAGTIAVAAVFADVFGVAAVDRQTASTFVLLSGLAMAITIASSPASSVLLGLQRYDLQNTVSVIVLVTSAAGTVLVLLAGGGVIGLGLVGVATTVLGIVLSIALVRRIRPDIHIGYRAADRTLVRPILSFSLSVFAIEFAGQLQMKTDEIVIGVFRPLAAITPYALARRLRDLALTFADQFSMVLFPLASELNAREDRERLRTVYIGGTRIALSLMAPLAIGLVVLGGSFLTAWVGPENGGAADVLTVLAVAALFDCSTWPAGYILEGLGRNRVLAAVSLLSGLVNVTLSIVLVQSLGVLGVAYATLIPAVIETVAIVLPYAMRVMQVSLREFVFQIVLPVAAPGVLMVVVIELLARLIGVSDMLRILIIGGLAAAVYALVYLSLSSAAPERRVAITAANRVWRAIRR